MSSPVIGVLELAVEAPPIPLVLATVPPALPLVPPTELVPLEPLGDVLALGVVPSELVLPDPLMLLPVVLAMLPVPLPLALEAPEMLYFCSSSATREVSVDICCLICSTSLDAAAVELEGVVTVELEGVVTVELEGVDSLVLLLATEAGAPGAGVVTTAWSCRSLQPANAVQTASALAANMNLLRAISLSVSP